MIAKAAVWGASLNNVALGAVMVGSPIRRLLQDDADPSPQVSPPGAVTTKPALENAKGKKMGKCIKDIDAPGLQLTQIPQSHRSDFKVNVR